MHETYLSVLLSPAHLLAEVTVTAATDLVLYPFVRWAIRRHDRRHHPISYGVRLEALKRGVDIDKRRVS